MPDFVSPPLLPVRKETRTSLKKERNLLRLRDSCIYLDSYNTIIPCIIGKAKRLFTSGIEVNFEQSFQSFSSNSKKEKSRKILQ